MYLRIPAIHGAKTTKNHTPLAHLAQWSSNRVIEPNVQGGYDF